MRFPQSLRAITAFYGLAFVVAILAASAIFYMVSIRSLIEDVDARLSIERSVLLAGAGGSDLVSLGARIGRHEALRDKSDLSYLLADRMGRPLVGRLRMRLPPAGFSDVDYDDGVEGIDHGRALLTRLADGSSLLLIADYGPLEAFNARMVQAGALILPVILAIGVLGGVVLSRAIGRRIEATVRIAESIMHGELDKRMPRDGSNGAFDRQAAVFNAMLDRIQSLMGNLQQVSSDVAHDLRTPLSRLRTTAARLAVTAPSEVRSEDLQNMLMQSEQLLAVFGAILRIAEVETGSRRAHFGPVDLGALALELTATFAPFIEEGGGSLTALATQPVVIDGDRELLSQALINLIDNAAKYAGPGAHIKLSVDKSQDEIRIAVSDDGPGIALQDRDKALRRFGRLDESRSKPGNGLGLSLVTSVARLHGGRFTLGDAKPGFVALIVLPRAD